MRQQFLDTRQSNNSASFLTITLNNSEEDNIGLSAYCKLILPSLNIMKAKLELISFYNKFHSVSRNTLFGSAQVAHMAVFKLLI